jgi:basic membrane lipoprotein Med (substrate-binding protein (PBP1-ABC) superfamily)
MESWQVVSQRQSSQLVNGQFTEVMVVTFRTSDGVTGDVSVPLSQYSADNVKQLIDARVQKIAAVHSLTSSSPPQGGSSPSS